MFESWWFRFLHFGVHSSSAQQERQRRLRRRWRCKWLGGGSSGCSARSTHRFPRSLHHILPDNSSPTAFGDRRSAAGARSVGRSGPSHCAGHAATATASTVCSILTGPNRASAAGGRADRLHQPSPEWAGPPQATNRFWGSISELAPRCCSTLHSSKHQLSLARFSLTPDLWSSSFQPSPPRSLAGWLAGWFSLSLSPSVFLFLAGPQRALQLAHRNQPQSITRPDLY